MSVFNPGPQDAAGAVLSCRNLWKIYGKYPRDPFDRGQPLAPGDSARLAEDIRRRGAVVAASDVSFDVHEGETFVIMGLSGSGKSTVIRCLARLVEPTAGSVRLHGDDLLKATPRELASIRRHKMGMVFQNFGLLPHLTVAENVSFPLSLQGIGPAQRQDRVAEVIELVGLRGRENSFPRELSGGQQQRVGIARSLVVNPEIWFLDEPFSALDPLIRRQMQDEFIRIQNNLRKSIVFITHDFHEAMRVADRMMIMRDGRIIQMGTPLDLILSPVDDYVAEFSSDVSRSKVLRVGDAMETTAGEMEGFPEVLASAPLESALPKLVRCPSGISVKSDGGDPVGVLTARGVVSALAGTPGRT